MTTSFGPNGAAAKFPTQPYGEPRLSCCQKAGGICGIKRSEKGLSARLKMTAGRKIKNRKYKHQKLDCLASG